MVSTSPDHKTARRRTPWALKDLVLLVVLGVVFGFIYWVFVQAWTALSIAMGPAGDLAQHFLAMLALKRRMAPVRMSAWEGTWP